MNLFLLFCDKCFDVLPPIEEYTSSANSLLGKCIVCDSPSQHWVPDSGAKRIIKELVKRLEFKADPRHSKMVKHG